MSKKLLMGLAPVLAAAAFAAMPAAAQAACTPPACAHVYKNGVISSEGKKLRLIGWGTLKLKNATLGEVECHTVGGGYTENPVGGGIATGKTQAASDYECVSPSCLALGGKGIAVTVVKLPWTEELTEPKAGVFRIKVGFKGPEKNKKPTGEGFIDFKVNCEGVTTPEFFGEQRPLVLNNGIAIGSGPTEGQLEPEKVNPESPDLESELVGTGETEGRVKVEGYAGEELIEVKNP